MAITLENGSQSSVTILSYVSLKTVSLSHFFKIGRGCRQGDPISSYIFLICVELMAIMIRQNMNIKGIRIFGNEYKILQYADDTALLLDGTENSLKMFFL